MDSLQRAQPDSTSAEERPSGRLASGGVLFLEPYAVLFGCALAVFVSDQVLKALVVRSLRHGQYIDLLGGLVRIDFTRILVLPSVCFSQAGSYSPPSRFLSVRES